MSDLSVKCPDCWHTAAVHAAMGPKGCLGLVPYTDPPLIVCECGLTQSEVLKRVAYRKGELTEASKERDSR